MHRSVYGRYLFAVGRNEEAARYSGINTKQIISSAYMVSGLLMSISAILFAFYSNAIAPSSHGNFYELYGIAAGITEFSEFIRNSQFLEFYGHGSCHSFWSRH